MSWGDTIYVQFPDEPTARAVAVQLGVDFPPDGSIPSGNANFALCAPIPTPWIVPPVYDYSTRPPVLITPGEAETGYWAMVRLNETWEGYAATAGAMSVYARALADPPVVWA